VHHRTAQGIGLGLIVLAATLPFLGKAFHIDDPLYLAVARQILVRPWDPYGAQVLWERDYESLFDADFNPPLWSYLLAGVMKCTGEPQVQVVETGTTEHGAPTYSVLPVSRLPELAMHGLEALFVAAAIVALHGIAVRTVRWPLTATALIALSPAMLPGQNVMLEGPVLAFWFGCLWCYMRGIETGAGRWHWFAGALAACSVMTKYTSAVVILLVACDIVRRRRWRDLWPLSLPVLAVALWSLHNWFVYERLHVLVIFSRAQTGGREPVGVRLFESWGRLLAACRAIGATTALVIPVFGIVLRRMGVWVSILLVCVGLAGAWLGKRDMMQRLVDRDGPGVEFPDGVAAHVLVFGASGTVALAGLALCFRPPVRAAAAVGAEARSIALDEPFLWLWVAAVIVFGIAASPFLAVRHLIPGIPPLVWLTLRRFEAAYSDRWQACGTILLGLTTVVSTILGFLVAKADYDFAGWYRHLAFDVASRTVEAGRVQGKTVWYTGHWGWAYYAERAGVRPYIPGVSTMNDGDFLLLPQLQTWQLPPKELYRYLKGLMRPIAPTPQPPTLTGIGEIDRAVHWCTSGIRSISSEVHFYGPGTLAIPWQFSRRPLDLFNVIEVRSEPATEAPAPDPIE
jgi:hypothetical protein